MSKKVLIAALSIALLITISIGAYFLFTRNKETESDNNDLVYYSKIDIRSKNGNEYFGSVWIKDNKIQNDLSQEDIRSFVDDNKNEWETSKLEYPTGGMLDNGAIWDGVENVNIQDENFIIAIFTILDDEFGDQYEVNLVED